MANTALDPNRHTLAASLRVLLADLIDYAGLFPPAGLSMQAAVDSYARYLASADRWALARFVVPASRLGELEVARARHGQNSIWRVSALVSASVEADSAAIHKFNEHNQHSARVDAIEARAATEADILSVTTVIPPSMSAFFEVRPNLAAVLLPAIKAAKASAKIRTGGVTADMIPNAGAVAGFVRACAEKSVAFKATAGLHHPLRCLKPLTYEPNAPTGVMHGFLNVFLAAALARQGASEATLTHILGTEDLLPLEFSDAGVHGDGWFVSTDKLDASRKSFAVSFGSCSFEEPLADLRELGLL